MGWRRIRWCRMGRKAVSWMDIVFSKGLPILRLSSIRNMNCRWFFNNVK